MKERFWNLPADIQQDIMASLDDMFRDMFMRMNVGQTGELVARHTSVKVVPVPLPPFAPNEQWRPRFPGARARWSAFFLTRAPPGG